MWLFPSEVIVCMDKKSFGIEGLSEFGTLKLNLYTFTFFPKIYSPNTFLELVFSIDYQIVVILTIVDLN